MSGKTESAVGLSTAASRKSLAAAPVSVTSQRLTDLTRSSQKCRASQRDSTSALGPVEEQNGGEGERDEEDDAENDEDDTGNEEDDSGDSNKPNYEYAELQARQHTEAQIRLLEEKSRNAQLIAELRAEQSRVNDLNNQLERVQIAHNTCIRNHRDALARCQRAESKVAEYSKTHRTMGQKSIHSSVAMQRVMDQLSSVTDEHAFQKDTLCAKRAKNVDQELDVHLAQKNSEVMRKTAADTKEVAHKNMREAGRRASQNSAPDREPDTARQITSLPPITQAPVDKNAANLLQK